ncbi:hypothetical protein CI109_106070 [Kwoniella shandongensis]|uniref:Uncharacterized protein n=1 Tax=Kwoniella shandongensis TaxID=1734106 RepID=A0A5M6BT16_9TREE|nr:uncharacterized protein CI109_006392 [Kwoniella shandongensis]KAA5525321.1 hypothetical protein CI109_006392 [Kwoniella shandongensis]
MTSSTTQTQALSSLSSIREPPCELFTITQYQCSPIGGRVTCWPIERIFRQCGAAPAIEVTNRLLSTSSDETIMVDPKFLEKPPKARNWGDFRS